MHCKRCCAKHPVKRCGSVFRYGLPQRDLSSDISVMRSIWARMSECSLRLSSSALVAEQPICPWLALAYIVGSARNRNAIIFWPLKIKTNQISQSCACLPNRRHVLRYIFRLQYIAQLLYVNCYRAAQFIMWLTMSSKRYLVINIMRSCKTHEKHAHAKSFPFGLDSIQTVMQ